MQTNTFLDEYAIHDAQCSSALKLCDNPASHAALAHWRYMQRKRELTRGRVPHENPAAVRPHTWLPGVLLWYRHYVGDGEWRDVRVVSQDFDPRTGRHIVVSEDSDGLTYHASLHRLQQRQAGETKPRAPWPPSPLVTALERRECRA